MEYRNRYETAENNVTEGFTLVHVKSSFPNNISDEDIQQVDSETRKSGFRTLLFLAEVLLGIFDTLNPGLGIRYLLS